MRKQALPLVVLVAALAGLAGSGAWALNRGNMNGTSWMHNNSSSWMMSYRSGSAQPVRTIADARQRAQAFADRLDLKVAEVLQFSNNYYARLDDKSGKPATEVLIDPATGSTSLEYGPAMMWNTRYGMMSGRSGSGMMRGIIDGNGMGSGMGSGMMNGTDMMGSAGGPNWAPSTGSVTGPVSSQQAIALADRWLAQRDSSLSVPDADAFPGYYSMEVERHGKIVGMLSVNASTGAIWNHWWHGSFVAISK
ncbi:MAG TPA: hypothetical protein VIL77_05830 [Gaiellaceae bacterium]